MGLGLILFRQIVAPVRAMTTAAQSIADGDLEQRVSVSTSDELGQLARAFNQMADALDRNRILRRNMIADIAHELKTPLSVLRANLEAMIDGVLPTSPEEITVLHNETTLLSRLISDLRLLSLAEAGQLTLARSTIDFKQLAVHTVERMRPQAEAEDIQLVTHVAEDLPHVDIDMDRMSQVLGNLLGNALRHTSSKGQVSLQVYQHATDGDKPGIIVEVKDTGEGILPEDLPFVFDRFYRADKSRSRASGGSGIGLAIVKQLVEAHGGHAWAESAGVGSGSAFKFTLPTHDPAQLNKA
jgi:signal transduction histidine kinase